MTIKDIFETMEYGPAPESAVEALAWIANRGGIMGHFIDGEWTSLRDDFATTNPATGEKLAGVTKGTADEVALAVKAARKAQPAWAKDTHARARVLYAIARLMQKHARLLAVMETLDNGKPIREARDIDVPLAIRHFYYHAGMAQLMDDELPDREALGICGQIIPWNFPLLMLAWKIAPALAMGNTVVLKPAEFTPMTAMLFCEICTQAGVPAGVVNIVTGDGDTGAALVDADVDKVAFTGSTEVGRIIRKQTAGSGKALSLELGGKSPYIVFEDADIESAVEGLVDAIWFNQGQVCCAGSRLLVQEGIAEKFYIKLKARMSGLRIGNPLDKCIDVGAIVDPSQRAMIAKLVADNTEGETFQTAAPEGCYYPPTLITGLHPASHLMQTEIFGPVLVATTFRTPSEAVEIANNTRYGLSASVWSENINLALDIAPKLVAGIVWINGTNMMDAAAGFGGVRESGFGREGGWEGLAGYTKPKLTSKMRETAVPFTGTNTPTDPLDRTAKLYIGGKQSRPDSGYTDVVYGPEGALIGHVSKGNRKDIRNAVEAMNSAKKWSKTTGHFRAQILYFLAENLSVRADEFSKRIHDLTGTFDNSEVQDSIKALFTYAAWADKYDGQVHGVPIRGVALAMKEPLGNIGILCGDAPLLDFVTPMAAAIAMGNRTTLVPSHAFPLVGTDFIQLLETSDIPAGVVNIVTGNPSELGKTLSDHFDVDAIWNFGCASHTRMIETNSAGNLKRTWAPRGTPSSHEYLMSATEVKNIWIPYGE